MIKIKMNKQEFICQRELNKFNDLLQEYQFLCGTDKNKNNLLFYFIDGEGDKERDKVVIQNDSDLEEFKKQTEEFLMIIVEYRDKESFDKIVYNKELIKDAMKQKIMKLLEQY